MPLYSLGCGNPCPSFLTWAALQPCLTLELYLQGKREAMCFPKQFLVVCQEARRSAGIAGDSDRLLTPCFPAKAGLAPEGGPERSSLEGTSGGRCGWGALLFFPETALARRVTTPPSNRVSQILSGSHSQERMAPPPLTPQGWHNRQITCTNISLHLAWHLV